MSAPLPAVARDRLLERRDRLAAVLERAPAAEPITRLLREVDDALARIDTGTYGLCAICHDPLEADRLEADPLLRNCLAHLTAAEREALEQDLSLSARVQAQLLPPRRLRHAPWDLAYHYAPLGSVSGDYCDALTTPDGALHFFLGDVAGKGVAASLLMAHLHATFRSLVELALPLGEMLARANRLFCESTGGHQYATLVCGRATGDGRLDVCNAGHCPPLVLSDGHVAPVPAGSLPLGLFCTTPFTTTPLHLEAGDALLLYTDGLSEARNREDEEYGVERLTRAAARRRGLAAADLVQDCLTEVTAFRSGTPLHDDLTLFALRREA